jgi:hypothetical protein
MAPGGPPQGGAPPAATPGYPPAATGYPGFPGGFPGAPGAPPGGDPTAGPGGALVIPGYLGPSFAAIVTASVSGNKNYLRDGNYLLCAKEFIWRQAKMKGGKQDWVFVVKWVVLASARREGALHLNGKLVPEGTVGGVQVEPQRPGEESSFAAPMGKTMAAVNAKALLMAFLGKDEATFERDEAEAAARRAPLVMAGVHESQWPMEARSPFSVAVWMLVQPNQPMRGAVIRASTYRKQNSGQDVEQNKGTWMAITNYIHAPHDKVEIKRRRDLLDAGLSPLLPTDVERYFPPGQVAANANAMVGYGGAPAPGAPIPIVPGVPPGTQFGVQPGGAVAQPVMPGLVPGMTPGMPGAAPMPGYPAGMGGAPGMPVQNAPPGAMPGTY